MVPNVCRCCGRPMDVTGTDNPNVCPKCFAAGASGGTAEFEEEATPFSSEQQGPQADPEAS